MYTEQASAPRFQGANNIASSEKPITATQSLLEDVRRNVAAATELLRRLSSTADRAMGSEPPTPAQTSNGLGNSVAPGIVREIASVNAELGNIINACHVHAGRIEQAL